MSPASRAIVKTFMGQCDARGHDTPRRGRHPARVVTSNPSTGERRAGLMNLTTFDLRLRDDSVAIDSGADLGVATDFLGPPTD